MGLGIFAALAGMTAISISDSKQKKEDSNLRNVALQKKALYYKDRNYDYRLTETNEKCIVSVEQDGVWLRKVNSFTKVINLTLEKEEEEKAQAIEQGLKYYYKKFPGINGLRKVEIATGQPYSLICSTYDKKCSLLKITKEYVGGKIPKIIGTGYETISEEEFIKLGGEITYDSDGNIIYAGG